MNDLVHDLRYGLRMLARTPGFTAVAILTLALGIGANTAVFSLVDGMYLRPWPVRHPGRLVWISTTTERSGGYDASSFPDYLELSGEIPAFSGVAAWDQRGAFISGEGQGQLVSVDVVSENYFDVLGVRAALGRLFSSSPAESSAQGDGVVLSDALWRKRYASDPALPGKSILLDGRDFTILGVAPPDFRGLEKESPTDLWVTPGGWNTMVPGAEREYQIRRNRRFSLMARLGPAATLAGAQTQLRTLAERLAVSHPADDKGISFRAIRAAEKMHQGLGTGLFLMAMAGLVLLIACANVASLLLAQTERRRKEVAVRLALGASRMPLLSQLLAESLLLALAGGALGLLLAAWLLDLLPLLASLSAIPAATGIRIDFRVLLFAIGLALLTAILFGLAPGLTSFRVDLLPLLKGEEPRLGARGRLPLRSLLVAAEIALSVVLLASSGLLLRSLLFSQRIRPGFDPHKNVLLLTLAPPVLYGYTQAQAASLYPTLAARFAALPGVASAAYARRPPISGSETGETVTVAIPGRQTSARNGPSRIRYNVISQDFFAAIGARLLLGRDFNRFDTPTAPLVVVINHELAREFWPNQSAVGRRILVDGEDNLVIGVVETGRYVDIHEPAEPYVFLPYSQHFSAETWFFVQTSGSAQSLVPAVLAAARGADKNLPIVDATTLRRYLAAFLAEERASAQFLGSLGLLGMFLAAVGLYGVVAWLVQRRTREIGIRMALGAGPVNILRLALGQGIRLAGWGAAIGFLAAGAVARLMSHRLYGVKSTDPLTYLVAITVAVFIALLACLFPAHRATRVSPIVALRHQ
ncbi:MAG TPA: ABC transporter permease [Candidatus Acidoferrales bacterium]|nr:ABC transporter permease [Candidatus Acidoferrales bacterium]